MLIGDKFTGLDMEELIGKPLKAEDDAKIMFEQMIKEYSKEVELDIEIRENKTDENS